MREYVAEFIATFALVFIGAGAVAANVASNGALGIVGIALAHGLVLMAMVFALGHVSGAHANPAVTIALFSAKKIDSSKAIGYIASQLLGAAVAGFLLIAFFSPSQGLGVPALGQNTSFWQGALLEAILTFFLVTVVFGVAVDKKGLNANAGLAIGLVLAFDILMGGTLTGAAMNPARAFGPAIASGQWANQLAYWIGPIVGGLAAALAYDKALKSK